MPSYGRTMSPAQANDDRVIRDLRRENERLRAALTRVQELATDTPSPDDYDEALNAIVRECEDALSEGSK